MKWFAAVKFHSFSILNLSREEIFADFWDMVNWPSGGKQVCRMMNLRFLSTAKIISSTRKCHVLQYVCVGGGGCHVLRGEYRVPSGVTLPTPATAPAAASVPSYPLWSRCCVCHYNIYTFPVTPAHTPRPPGRGARWQGDYSGMVLSESASTPPPTSYLPEDKTRGGSWRYFPIITARVWVRGTDQWGGGGGVAHRAGITHQLTSRVPRYLSTWPGGAGLTSGQSSVDGLNPLSNGLAVGGWGGFLPNI